MPKIKFIKIPVAVVLLTIMFGVILAFNLSIKANQQFIYLADSFSKGRLDFQEKHLNFLTVRKNDYGLIWTDTAEWQGKKYWPLGPFPALLLVLPVKLFGTKFLQGYLSFALTLLNFFLLWSISRRQKFRVFDALFLAAFFIFGSAYLGVATFSVSWYFGQIVAITLLLLALYEYLRHIPEVRPQTEVGPLEIRWWLIGLYLALAIITRNTFLFTSLFFVIMIFFEKKSLKIKLKNLFLFSSYILASIFLILLYNWARFGNPLEGGYNLQEIPPVLARAREIGLFSFKHIPGNLYFMLFRSPDPVLALPDTYILKYPYITANIWGLGIFFTAPVLLYIFNASSRDREIRALTVTSLITLIPIITYYGIGVSQIGYRYILDIYPLLYVILGKALTPRLPLKAKILIVLGIILNWHLLLNFKS